MAKLVDAADLKSAGLYGPYGFESHLVQASPPGGGAVRCQSLLRLRDTGLASSPEDFAEEFAAVEGHIHLH